MKLLIKILFVFPLLLVSLALAHGQNTKFVKIDALAKAVNDLAREEVMRHASLSVSVYSLDKKSQVYAYNSQQSMIPASLTKLFTTAAGFDKLGSNFRFRTTLAYSGEIDKNGVLHGDVFIIGGGDPLLGSYRYRQTVPDTLFAQWHRALVSAGIKSVDGKVCYDATIFDNHPIHDTWQWGDIGNYYGTGASGLNFHENMFFIYFNPGAKVGYPASVTRCDPKGLSPHVISEVMTGPVRSGDQVVVYGDPASVIRTCSGTMPIDGKSFSVRASLPKPAQTCADLFVLYLRQHKLPVSGGTSESLKRPSNLVSLLEYTSPTYYVIAQYANMTSNNLYAEAIHRYLGFKSYGMGSNANGVRAVNDFIQRLRIESSGVRLEDGCGLGVNNRVTSDFVCRFLVEMSKCSFFNEYEKSLALAGENGTVKHLLTGLPQNVSVRMKTGSMTGVRAFAGYVTNSSGERYCFSVICNDFDCTGNVMRSKLEKIIMKIATISD